MIIKKPTNKAELEDIIKKIYQALLEKGYDPSSQLAGYILSEDPVYIPDWDNARGMIRHIDRDDLLRIIIDFYFENRFTDIYEEKNK